MTHVKRYAVVIALVAMTCVIEFVGHADSNGLGLLSDALHLLGDSVPLIIGLALVIAHRYGKDIRSHEVSLSLINAIVLFGFAAWIAYDAYHRFLVLEPVSAASLPFAIAGVIGNGLQVYFGKGLKDAHSQGATYRAQILHMGVDFAASIAVVVGSLLVILLDSPYPDTIASAFVVVLMIVAAWVTMRASRSQEHDHTYHHHH